MAKQYDLENRTLEFAKGCRDLVKKIPRTISNIEYGKQLVRSSDSTGSNYIAKPMNHSLEKILLCELKFAKKKPEKAVIG